MRILTNAFRALAVLSFAVILLINAEKTLTVTPAVSAWLVFGACMLTELAMLCQTIMNRENNSCRQNFGYKLMTVCFFFITSVVLLIVNLT